jgi:DNA mismatch endonuclease, patch repair protein
VSGWVSTEAGQHLRGRKQSNTEPELALRRALHRAGFRFRLRRSLSRGCNPDIVLPKYHLAVWVDGCYWHGHETHARLPLSGPNVDLWKAKIRANRERDARAVAVARGLGWRCLRVWECEIRDDLPAVVDRVRMAIEQPPRS